jgi:LAO/AO transport system kinase
MQQHAVDDGVFIRSMGTRGSLGGLSRAARDAVKAMDAFGFDLIIVETVGVGQGELDVMHMADTVVVVLTPGAGDLVQVMKAGIMEIANVFAINKSDLPDANRVAMEVEMMLGYSQASAGWRPPVIKTSSNNETGLQELASAINDHHRYLEDRNIFTKLRGERIKAETLDVMSRQWQQMVYREIERSTTVSEILESVAQKQTDPHSAASSIIDYMLHDSSLLKHDDH